MLDHIILTVSDVERSLKFYEAALMPLKIAMFMPFKGAEGHPDLWGVRRWQKGVLLVETGQTQPCGYSLGVRGREPEDGGGLL